MPLFRGLFVRKDTTRGTTPVEARKGLAGLFAPLGAAGARPGLLSGGNIAGTSGWAYAVPAFHAVLSRGAADGVVLAGNDGPITASTDPAPATGSRIDIVYVRHADVDAGDPTSAPGVDVAKGVASGAPQAPALPVGALELARATVASTATSTQHAGVTITQTAQRTALRGTPVPVRDKDERDAYLAQHLAAGGVVSPLVPFAVSRPGSVVDRTVDGVTWSSLERRVAMRDADGGAPPAGVVPFTQYFVAEDKLGANGVLTVLFLEPFAKRPIVQAKTVRGAAIDPVIDSDGVTATNVRLVWPNMPAGTTVRVHVTANGWAP